MRLFPLRHATSLQVSCKSTAWIEWAFKFLIEALILSVIFTNKYCFHAIMATPNKYKLQQLYPQHFSFLIAFYLRFWCLKKSLMLE
jgi:hypothetical protein